MWADVQKGCGMGLGGYADLRVPSFVHTTLHTMHTILHTIFGHSVQLKSWFIRGFRGTAHYAHHFISLIYENKITLTTKLGTRTYKVTDVSKVS